MTEKLPADSLDTITLNRKADVFFGYDQTQAVLVTSVAASQQQQVTV